MTQLLNRRGNYLRHGSLLLIAAIGLWGLYAWLFKPGQLPPDRYWMAQWFAACACFVLAFLLSSRQRTTRLRGYQWALLALESAAAIYLVWLFPSFVTTCLLVVVAWQIGWLAPLRTAIVLALLQAAVLAAMKCVGDPAAFQLLILVIACGFQAFAITAAHLARSEASARDELEKVNSQLRATQALMTETARMSERLRISRDLHDALGHNLTTLAIHLDVADRLASGQAAEHVHCAREVAGTLLAEVRSLVSRVGVEPMDLRATLSALAEAAVNLKVRLILPEALSAVDPARADALFRCVQEVMTNTLRHAGARELLVRLEQSADGTFSISTRDDGRGGPFVEGRGLKGMRERFESLGGTLSVRCPPGGGFGVDGTIPVAGSFP
ncbi:MAG: sensor histidine kinase [Steroidobacteraceae bacterium]